jgi:hypothetical protein
MRNRIARSQFRWYRVDAGNVEVSQALAKTKYAAGHMRQNAIVVRAATLPQTRIRSIH